MQPGAKVMNDGPHRHLCEQELAFFGRIGADVTHEVRNVLSVIGEYAGLLDDLVTLSENAEPVDCAKLQKLSAGLSRQVRKGTDVMERFSRFAHATDDRRTSFDLTELTRNMAAMAQRRVALAGCRLEAELPHEPTPVTSNPFSLQHAIFSAIQVVLDSPERGELVTINLGSKGSTAVISIANAATGGAELCSPPAQLSLAMKQLGGTVETSFEDGMLSLRLAVPLR